MPTTKDLREDIKTLATKAADTVANAQLSQPEKAEALDGIENDLRVKTIELQTLEVGERDTKGIEAQRADIAGGDTTTADVETRTMGRQFVESENFKSIAGQKRFSSGPVEVKATMTTAASPVVQPQLTPGIVDLRFDPPKVETLMAPGSTTSNVVRYLREVTATNAAAAVAEGGLKPESTLILADADDPVRKVATTFKVSDEMLEDVAQTASYIDARGRLFIDLEVNDQLLNGSGTGVNVLGLRNRTGLAADLYTGAGTTPDAVYNQITVIRSTSFMEPDGLIIHPKTWATLRLAKDDNGQYYAGGPFMGQYGVGGFAGDSLWGLPVVITTAIEEDVILVGAFRTCSQVFNRKGLTVESTNSNEDDFKHDLVAFRFERRLALAVYRPGAFGEVKVGNAP